MNQPDNTPVLIQAGYSPGVGSSSLVLHTDGSYEFFSGAMLTSHTVHGQFSIKDSFVFLSDKKEDKAPVSGRLLIDASKIIYRVDSNGKRIQNAIPFLIHIDNRNK